MKARYIFAILAAGAMTLTGCNEKYEVDDLAAGQLSSSYIAIPQKGGDVKVTLNANSDWALDYDVTFETDSLDPQQGKVNYNVTTSQLALKNDNEDNTWFTASPAHGEAGRTEITFNAPASNNDHTSNIRLKIGDSYQNIIVMQKAAATELPVVSVQDVLKGTDNTTYRVKGYCGTIANTQYGNWYMVDDDKNSLYIYGTVDGSGSYNWSSFNIEPGDEVTVEGPRTTYGSTVELKDASFISVVKALLTSDVTTKTIEQNAEPFKITLTQKGTSLKFSSDSKWLSFEGDGYTTDADGHYIFTINPSANATGKVRTGNLIFESTKIETKDDKTDTLRTPLTIPVTQMAATPSTTGIFGVSQLLKDGTRNNHADYYVDLNNAKVTYKDGSNIFIEDETGGLNIYSNSSTLKAGDVVNGHVWGEGYAYNGLPEATTFNDELAKVSHNNTVEPTVVTLAELAANYDKYVSRYIRIVDATLADAIDVTYTGVKSAGSITDGTNTFSIAHQSSRYNQKNLSAGKKATNMYYYFQAAKGSTISLNCIPAINNGKKQLKVFGADWLK